MDNNTVIGAETAAAAAAAAVWINCFTSTKNKANVLQNVSIQFVSMLLVFQGRDFK